MRARKAIATLSLLILNGLFSVPVGADGVDEIRITNQDAWNCSQVIGVRPFGVVGKFKGKQPPQAYMGLLLAELTAALRTAPGVLEVVEVIPEMTMAPDLVIEGEFLELNTGSRATRFWVGMGAGKSKCAVQVRGLTNPGRVPVFDLHHERISAMGLASDELAENVGEVGRDIGRALAQVHQVCNARTVAATPGNAAPATAPNAVEGRGVFAIESTPTGAEVYVDGEFVGTTPIAEQILPAGKHEIELTKKGLASWKRHLSVSAGARATVAAEMEPEAPVSPPQP